MAGLGDLMKQAQRLKAEMERIQAEAATKTVEGSAGGGMVTAIANGKGELLSVRIDPAAVREEDLDMLQDLITAAANDALRKARELLAQDVSRLTGGLVIGDGTRIASGAALYAFDHGMKPDRELRDQPVRSRGIRLGRDVWIGANAGITDGVTVGDHAVVAMGAVVTRDVPDWAIVAGVPAVVVGDRRDR